MNLAIARRRAAAVRHDQASDTAVLNSRAELHGFKRRATAVFKSVRHGRSATFGTGYMHREIMQTFVCGGKFMPPHRTNICKI